MPMNKGIMVKYQKQKAEVCSYAHIKACATERTDHLYDVFNENTIIKRGLTLEECARMGRGYKFVRAA